MGQALVVERTKHVRRPVEILAGYEGEGADLDADDVRP
jgi:hypothetical protein